MVKTKGGVVPSSAFTLKFEDNLQHKSDVIETNFNENLQKVLQNFESDAMFTHGKFQLFDDSNEERGQYLVSYNNYQKWNSPNEKSPRTKYVKVFRTQISIPKLFRNSEYKRIATLCKDLTEKDFSQKLETIVNDYKNMYHPLRIFRHVGKDYECYIFVQKEHIVYTQLFNSNALPSDNMYIETFEMYQAKYNRDFKFFENMVSSHPDMVWISVLDEKKDELKLASRRKEDKLNNITMNEIIMSYNKEFVSPKPATAAAAASSSPKKLSPKATSKSMTVEQLKAQAKSIGIKNYSKLKKQELIDAISQSPAASGPR